jgi:hypothetical protein
VNDPQNICSVDQWKIQDENDFKSFNPEDSHSFETCSLEARMPPDIRMRSEERKRLMRRQQEFVTKFGRGGGCVVVCLVLKITVRSGPDYVAAFAHSAPVFFKRSSSRRCFSSQ